MVNSETELQELPLANSTTEVISLLTEAVETERCRIVKRQFYEIFLHVDKITRLYLTASRSDWECFRRLLWPGSWTLFLLFRQLICRGRESAVDCRRQQP
jgi:hypothetical protein